MDAHQKSGKISIKVKGHDNVITVNPTQSEIHVSQSNSGSSDEEDDGNDNYNEELGLAHHRPRANTGEPFLIRCRAEVLQFYRTKYRTVQLLPWDDTNTVKMDDIYTHTTMVQYNKLGACQMEWKTSSYEELFKRPNEWRLKNRVLVEGKSGCGKSTFVAKMTHDWTDQDPACVLSKFKLLFVLDMRLVSPSDSLVDAIFNQILPGDSKVTAQELRDYLSSHPDEVLFILNSYDECSFSGSRSTLGDSKVEIDQVLSNKILRGCQVVVCTRPWRAEDFRKLYDEYSHVEILGYSTAASKRYIRKYFSHSQSDAEGLIGYLASSDELSMLACTPMLTALFCLLWEEREQDSTLPQTLSDIYDQVFSYLINRHNPSSMGNISPSNLPEDVRLVLLALGKLGLTGLISESETRVVFEAGELEKDVLHEACRMGILSRGMVRKKLKVKQSIWFVHKTFQEKCAGFYWVNLLNADDGTFKEYLSKIQSVEDVLSLQYLIVFACSMSQVAAQLIAKHLAKVYRSNLEEVTTQFYEDQEHLHYDIRDRYKQFLNVCLKCAYESGTGSLLSEAFCCLFQRNQIRFNCADTQSSTFHALTYFVRNAVASQSAAPKSNQLQSSKEREILVGAIKHPSSVSSSSSNKDIQSELPLVRFLQFYNMTSEHVNILTGTLPFLTNVEKLSIDGVYDVCESSVEAFANNLVCQQSMVSVSLVDFICDCSPIVSALQCPILQEICIRWMGRPEFSSSLASTLQFMPSLRVLQLPNNNLQPCHIRVLACQLKHIPGLREFGLSWNLVGDALEDLAANLSRVPQLQKLHLSHTGLTSQGVIKLGSNLVHIPSLTNIDLSDNEGISKSGFVPFFSNTHHLSMLEYLDFEDSISDEESIQSAAENLADIQTLSWIDLSARFLSPIKLSPSSCASLSTMLRNLPVLKELYLEHAYINDEKGWAELLSASSGNASLKLLRMTSKCVPSSLHATSSDDQTEGGAPSCLDLVGW